MNRRKFLQTSAAGLAMSAVGSYAVGMTATKPKRVGLIGTGWYGKVDLMRLIQVTPVEVVLIVRRGQEDAGRRCRPGGRGQPSKKRPRTYGDYRVMLAEKDLDIVLVGTPDHWHTLAMIAAVEAGADVYVQKPISVDVVEGQAMVAAARRHGRVVQVGTQRRSTPHLIEARDHIVHEGKLGHVGQVEICSYYDARAHGNPPNIEPPEWLDYEMWTGPAPMRPFNRLIHPISWRRSWSMATASSATWAFTCSTCPAGCWAWVGRSGFPLSAASSSARRAYPTLPTPRRPLSTTTTFDRLAAPHLGRNARSEVSLGGDILRRQGHAEGQRGQLRLHPAGRGQADPSRRLVEREQYPEDVTEQGNDLTTAPANRRHMRDFLAAIATRGRPVADIEEGHISTASCILANVALRAGPDAPLAARARPGRGGRRGQSGCSAVRTGPLGSIPNHQPQTLQPDMI